ncbi:MAG: hypothetical protein ACRDWB_13485, partial [Acidimicrobiales bacterium]
MTDDADVEAGVGTDEELDLDEDGTEVDADELEEAFEEELEHAAEKQSVPKGPNAFMRLYRGGTSFDFIGHRKWWFAISALVILAGLVSLGTRGLNEG